MPRKNPPITTVKELLKRLYIDPMDHGRTHAEVIRWSPNEPPKVVEHFDDGKGHSGAFSSDETLIDPGVFDEALQEFHISGKLKPGYVSRTNFLITEHGKKTLFKLLRQEQENIQLPE